MNWKIKIVCIFYLFTSIVGLAKNNESDSLLNIISTGKDDSLKVDALVSLAGANAQTDPVKATEYATNAMNLASKIGYQKGLAYAYKWLGIINNFSGNYYDALVYSNKSLNIFQSLNDEVGISNLLNNLGAFYADRGEESKAIEYYLESLQIAEQTGNKLRIETALANIGVVYSKNEATINKALEYYLKALPYALEINDGEFLGTLYTDIGEVYIVNSEFSSAHAYFQKALTAFNHSPGAAFTYNDLGKLYTKQKIFDSATHCYRQAYAIASEVGFSFDIAQSYIGMAQVDMMLHKHAEAISSYKQAIEIGIDQGLIPELKDAYEGLSTAYKILGDYKNAYTFKDSLTSVYNAENKKKVSFTTATFEYSIELQKQSGKIDLLIKEKEIQGLDLKRVKFIKDTSVAGLSALLIISFLLLRNIRQRKRLNNLLYKQKEEIEVQKMSVEATLSELKSAQSQLIQSEKMASLGELTAGIAHEIQNPLNFVNNFSEVSTELMQELKEELENGNTEEVMVIAKDIIQNLGKINHHGKRADAIVKGMLQHSRNNVGTREPTDLNALVEEFIRLTYHGLKAKDRSFNAFLKTAYDKQVGIVKVIPQDIGRVLLNLINNAFYAVSAQKKVQNGSYEPTVAVSTKKTGDNILISVKDNGSGIPQNVLDKIFQPFFTTKPTGQGTGLGLSLSYDIVKAHGGELKVVTKEGEGAEFIIQLPIV